MLHLTGWNLSVKMCLKQILFLLNITFKKCSQCIRLRNTCALVVVLENNLKESQFQSNELLFSMKHKPSDAFLHKLGIVKRLFRKRVASWFCCTYHKRCFLSVVYIEETLIFQACDSSFNRLKLVCSNLP
jgi:hypothetical protein